MQEKRLENAQSAEHDALTGLPNDGDFIRKSRDALTRAAQEKTPLALHIIHIANLKEIVINHGLPVAETILKTVSGRLYGVFQSGKIFARLGSDSFGLLQKDVEHRGHVLYVARRILENLDTPVHVLGQEFTSRIHIGIALCPDHGTQWEELYDSARLALQSTEGIPANTYKIYE